MALGFVRVMATGVAMLIHYVKEVWNYVLLTRYGTIVFSMNIFKLAIRIHICMYVYINVHNNFVKAVYIATNLYMHSNYSTYRKTTKDKQERSFAVHWISSKCIEKTFTV